MGRPPQAVLVGNPADGFLVIGPIEDPNNDEFDELMEGPLRKRDWWLVPIRTIDEYTREFS